MHGQHSAAREGEVGKLQGPRAGVFLVSRKRLDATTPPQSDGAKRAKLTKEDGATLKVAR
eukprot:6193687-Pleurochrysis_carterae.AAC.1